MNSNLIDSIDNREYIERLISECKIDLDEKFPNPPKFAIDVKIIGEQKSGILNIWGEDILETSVEDIINETKEVKMWNNGGKITEVSIRYTDINGKWHELYLDVKKNKFNQLLK